MVESAHFAFLIKIPSRQQLMSEITLCIVLLDFSLTCCLKQMSWWSLSCVVIKSFKVYFDSFMTGVFSFSQLFCACFYVIATINLLLTNWQSKKICSVSSSFYPLHISFSFFFLLPKMWLSRVKNALREWNTSSYQTTLLGGIVLILFKAAEDHNECHSCQIRTGKWG